MAKKSIPSIKSKIVTARQVAKPIRRRCVIRRSPRLPRPRRSRFAITQDQIARRAYEIYLSGTGGSESDNWHRAERELRGV